MDHTPSFRTVEVTKALGVTPRQLQWWDESNLIVPAFVGRNREYSQAEAFEIALISVLRRKAISIQRIRKVVAGLRTVELATKLRSGELFLLTDGKVVYVEFNPARAMQILVSLKLKLAVVSLSDCWRMVQGISSKVAA